MHLYALRTHKPLFTAKSAVVVILLKLKSHRKNLSSLLPSSSTKKEEKNWLLVENAQGLKQFFSYFLPFSY